MNSITGAEQKNKGTLCLISSTTENELFIHMSFQKCTDMQKWLYQQKVIGKGVPMLKHHTTMMYGSVEVNLHTFLTLALEGGDWTASFAGHFNPGNEPQHEPQGEPASEIV